MTKCYSCKAGTYTPGTTTVMLERGSTILVVRSVPAEVCSVCGDYLISEEVSERLMHLLDEAVRHGASVEVLEFAA